MSASRILNVCQLSGKNLTLNRAAGISINSLNKIICDFGQKREASTMTCLNNINPQIKLMEYAVRGPLVIRATEIEKELANVSKCFFCFCYQLFFLLSYLNLSLSGYNSNKKI